MQALVDFIQSLLGSLPSSSSVKSSSAVAFGELLVDLLWSIDIELDDIHSDAKLALVNAEQGNVPSVTTGTDVTTVMARVAKAKQSAESDKGTLAGLVKTLVVRSTRSHTDRCQTLVFILGHWNTGRKCLSRTLGTILNPPGWPHCG